MKQKLYFLLFLCMLQSFVFAQQKSNAGVIKTFHVAGNGGWDFLAINPVKPWLYLSHATQVNVINKNTGDSIATISNTMGVHGITFDSKTNKGFISNGKTNTITVFDLQTNKIIGEIKVGDKPDAILYDEFSLKIIVCNAKSNTIDIINPATEKVEKTIALDGNPEVPVSDGAGYLYVNIESKNEIAVIDAKTFIVKNYWTLLPNEGPTGLAMDIKTKRLFSGCEKNLVIMNAKNGKIIKTISIGEGCDGVAFDDVTHKIFASCGSGSITAIVEKDANTFEKIADIKTLNGARTIALDKDTHFLYVPTADFDSKISAKDERKKILENTFKVLVVNE